MEYLVIIQNKSTLILDQLINKIFLLNDLNESHFIACVLSLIVFILWCLLLFKRNRLKRKRNQEQQKIKFDQLSANLSIQHNQIQTPVTAKSSSKIKQNLINSNKVKFSSAAAIAANSASLQKDDGYLSDSALSFLSNYIGNGFNFNGPRFRKRDKLYFYGKKMLRQVSHVRGSISARSAEKSRKIVKIISKKILNIEDDSNSKQPSLQYRRNELPEFLLDIESSNQKNDHDLPTALINLIRSVKVFGYLDQRIILEMCKYMETKTIYANNYLFKIGEPDDSIYVVESGLIHVYITDEKGRKHLIKECTEGSHIFSLLSIMDVLTGDLKPYRTVSAKAIEDTSILRLPGKAFVDVLSKYPDYLVRITQIIIVRLQRVTFTALHGYLGLTSEIMRTELKNNNIKSYSSKSKDNLKKNKAALETKNTSSTNFINTSHDKDNIHDDQKSEIDMQQQRKQYYVSGRKVSLPLPPVSFFTQESEVIFI
jgi:CRP-like cAMP-binding protein